MSLRICFTLTICWGIKQRLTGPAPCKACYLLARRSYAAKSQGVWPNSLSGAHEQAKEGVAVLRVAELDGF